MYSSEWKEDVASDEEARFAALTERMSAIKKVFDEKYGERGRALHRQAMAGVRGTVRVPRDLALPPELHVGPLQPGAEWPTFIRFSSGNWGRTKKDMPDIRAVSLKLVGVPGRKILTGEETPRTQDFTLNHTPVAPTRTPEEFVAMVEAVAPGQGLALFRLIGKIGFGRALSVLGTTLSGLSKSIGSFATTPFFSMAPTRLGPTAAMWSLAPTDTRPGSGPLATDLAGRLAAGMRYDLRVRLYQDATRTPIEDPTRDWEGNWHTVGVLEIPATDLASPAAVETAAYIERLAFDPWHAVEELRPLGAINRARRAAYYGASASGRDVEAEPG